MAKKKPTKKPTKKSVKKAVKKVVKKATKKVVAKAKVAAKKVSVKSLNIGQPLPAFALPATGGKEISAESLKGKKVVLYFYPKDATSGCTLEGHEFTRLHEEFKKAGAEVIGVSKDSLKSHESFKTKENFSVDLLSDEAGKLTELFGVWKEKSMYGRKYMGIERSTFVIDENGVLQKEWRGVKVPGHAEEVLKTVKSL